MANKLEVYTNADMDLLADNITRIEEDVMKKRLELFDPKGDDVKKIITIVHKFIKEKKRKVYGGEALNKLISNIAPADSFYGEYELPDIDFYSPKPIDDLIELCNLLHAADFKPVTGQEAQHKGTYSIFVMYHNFVDISYVPTNVFHRMPFEEVNGINYIHPHFMAIDMFRIFTDPLLSYFRLEKTVKRFRLIQKHFPFMKVSAPLRLPSKTTEIKMFDKDINKFLTREDVILIGMEGYNQLAKFVGTTTTHLKSVDSPYPEVILTNFNVAGRDFVNMIKTNHPDMESHISVVEYYPFFQFLGHNAFVYYKGVPIIHMFHYDHRCIPVKQIGEFKIGAFVVQLLYAWSLYYLARTDKNNELMERYKTIFAHLIELRNEYFSKTNNNIFSNTPFADFSTDCVGETMPPEIEKRLRIEKNKRQGKPYVFKYEPSVKHMEPGIIKYNFANTAGTAVRNEKNLRLSGDIKEDYEEESETE